MELLRHFRSPDYARAVLDELHRITTRHWVIMEICGGQTHAIMQYGIDQLLPEKIELVHGPGCPVCVTPLELIDKALAIAAMPNVIFTSFGDMLRVPGSHQDLFSIRAAGGQVKTVYSPLDAVKIARENPDKEVVFFAIGFETTAPANVMAVIQAQNLGLTNFSILVSQALVPPAMHAILGSPENRVQGFLAAGHVCSIMGTQEYPPVAEQYRIPIVVTGFEPLDLLNGILMTVRQLEAGTCEVHNAYPRVVTQEGNLPAQAMIRKVYQVCDRQWRGIGMIPQSGWCLRPEYGAFDAEKKFDVGHIQTQESEICISGEVLQGRKKPHQCPAFGTLCTPRTPLGATMVSSEGACAAYYNFSRSGIAE
ncbi:MAG: hydrogenase formation protein HypD [Anaerolineae bacterium]|nr:hydrogenase formation protein HypD [Anaerolineae bacterium]